jgi:hypothetical protein
MTDNLCNITLTDIPESEIYTALVRASHFAGQWPDRVGARAGCAYSGGDYSGGAYTDNGSMYVYRTPKGRIVVRRSTPTSTTGGDNA